MQEGGIKISQKELAQWAGHLPCAQGLVRAIGGQSVGFTRKAPRYQGVRCWVSGPVYGPLRTRGTRTLTSPDALFPAASVTTTVIV